MPPNNNPSDKKLSEDIFTQAITGVDQPAPTVASGTPLNDKPGVSPLPPIAPPPTPTTPSGSEQTEPPKVTPVEPTKPLDKRELARLAMEGPEHTAKRKEEEHKTVAKKELTEIDERLTKIATEKSALELAWIDLDDKRTKVKTILDPIKDKEKSAETEEAALEESEAREPFPKEREATEGKRWEVQQKRHQIETEKWEVEQKLLALEDQVADNTSRYQKLLDEEDELKTKRDGLEKELSWATI